MKQQEIIPNVEEKIITLRNQQVILDCDVAELYGVETKRINEAVSNNPEIFPEGYIFEIDNQDVASLRSKFSTLKNAGRGQHTKYPPKAFTEKGLYMLATILKSPKAEPAYLLPFFNYPSAAAILRFTTARNPPVYTTVPVHTIMETQEIWLNSAVFVSWIYSIFARQKSKG